MAAIAVVVLAIDQLTKTWAESSLGSDRIVHVAGSLELALTRNAGVAFGLGQGVAPLLVAAALAAFVLGIFGRRVQLSMVMVVAVGLILGGAFGNVCDRVFRDKGGAVVDFIDLQWWPVFNVADAAIVVGALILVLVSARRSDPAKPGNPT